MGCGPHPQASTTATSTCTTWLCEPGGRRSHNNSLITKKLYCHYHHRQSCCERPVCWLQEAVNMQQSQADRQVEVDRWTER